MSTSSSVNNTLKLRLQGYTIGSNTPIASTDKLIDALGKIQGQISGFSGGADFGNVAENILPTTDNTYSVGNTTNRFLLQASTLGFGTTPTHTITIPSVGTGFAHYNTVDQVTNYERFRSYWSGNIYNLTTEKGGTGTVRGIFLNFASTGFYVSNTAAASGMMRVTTGNQTGTGSLFGVIGVLGASSGNQNGMVIAPAHNQTGSATSNSLLISPYFLSTVNTPYIINAGTNTGYDNGGTHTRLFSVDTFGNVYLGGSISTGGGSSLGSAALGFSFIYSNQFSSLTGQNLSLGIADTIGARMYTATRNWTLQDGGTFTDNGNRLQVTGNQSITGLLGLATASPTHTVTLGSTGTGFSHYNTIDQTTNYERVRQYWAGNTFNINSEQGGTGTSRNINLIASGTTIVIGVNSNSCFDISRTGGQLGMLNITGTSTLSTADNFSSIRILPTINQTGSAGYRGIWISPYEQSLGSGSKLLIDVGTNSVPNGAGTHTSLFNISNIGDVYISGKALIGSTVDNGAKLQVTGTSEFTGVITINSSTSASGIVLKGNDFPAIVIKNNSNVNQATWTSTTGNGGFFTNSIVGDMIFRGEISNSSILLGVGSAAATMSIRSDIVVIGGRTGNAVAIFEVQSTTKGAIPNPKMTTAQFNALASKPAGLTAYSTDDNGMLFYDGTRTVGHRYNGTKYQMYESTGGVWTDVN